MEALRHVGIKPLGQVIMVLGLGFVFWFGLLLVVDWLIGIESIGRGSTLMYALYLFGVIIAGGLMWFFPDFTPQIALYERGMTWGEEAIPISSIQNLTLNFTGFANHLTLHLNNGEVRKVKSAEVVFDDGDVLRFLQSLTERADSLDVKNLQIIPTEEQEEPDRLTFGASAVHTIRLYLWLGMIAGGLAFFSILSRYWSLRNEAIAFTKEGTLLEASDRDKVRIRAKVADDQMSFRWRISFPEGRIDDYQIKPLGLKLEKLESLQIPSRHRSELQIVFSVRKWAGGRVFFCYRVKVANWSSTELGVTHAELSEFAFENWKQVVIDVLADGRQLEIEPQNEITLLRISFTDKLRSRATSLSQEAQQRMHKPFIRLYLSAEGED